MGFGDLIGRGDFDGEEGFAVVALGADVEHEDDFGCWPLDGVGFPAFGELPVDLGGDADDAGLFPVGVVFTRVVEVEGDFEGLAGLDVGGVGDELDVEGVFGVEGGE